MPKKPDERIVQAKELFDSGMKLVEIASQLNLPEGTIRSWKNRNKWDATLQSNKRNVAKKRGGQLGNKNAAGQFENQHARKHGLFARFLPPGLNQIIEDMPKAPLDIIWDQIQILYANLLHSQSILYVEDILDKTTEVTLEGDDVTGYEHQQAWDKQRNSIGSLSRSMKDLTSLIKTYEELASKESGSASEEQKARLELLRAQTKKLEERGAPIDDGVQDKMDAITGIVSQMQMPKEEDL